MLCDMNDATEKQSLDEHLRPSADAGKNPEYQAWKEGKIKRALAQSEDRSKMVTAHKVWEELGLER